jgi:hypothetical protein
MDTPVHRRAFAAALLVAVALSACGGDGGASDEAEPPAAPSLPRALAEELAAASDDVAELLEAGDGCAAAERAAELREQALAAVESGAVPPQLERPLATAVERLATQIACEPATTEEDEDDEDERGKGKAKGKDKDKDKDKGDEEDEDDGDDEDDSPDGTTTTETSATTTEEG